MKFAKDGIVVEELNPNHYNIWTRMGFEVVEEVKEAKPKKK